MPSVVRPAILCAAVASLVLAALAAPAAHAQQSAPSANGPEVSVAERGSSPALRSLPIATAFSGQAPRVVANKPNPVDRVIAMREKQVTAPTFPNPTGPVGSGVMPGTGAGFDGMSNLAGYYPPDTDGDVGPNHYVQVVNSNVQVFSKSGATLAGPTALSVLWSGFGGDCEITNDGDPIVQYDRLADRWLVSQFAIEDIGRTGTFYECVAVSKTPDPTGAYNLYAFGYDAFNDYPKIGVWPDGYYVTYNMFHPTTFDFQGTKVCALDRTAMLNGTEATQQCFNNPYPGATPEASLLPSDLDGRVAPPAGSPNYMMALHWDDPTKLTMYAFHVDWATPANSTWTGPTYLAVNPYAVPCLAVQGTRCVIQPNTPARLDVLGDRAMFRLAYRNYGTHESLVFNHTVALGPDLGANQAGITWYEIRTPGTTPTVYQQGTTADPSDSAYRWMGSLAMDHQGNMALGYSASSATRYPSIAYVGRMAADPLGTMPLAESTIIEGSGSQTGTAGRWGDYSSMEVDPVDDCTFWYTSEYLTTTSLKSWRTRIASFTFPSCQIPGQPTSVTASAVTKGAKVSRLAPSYLGSPGQVVYTATASPGGRICRAIEPARSCTIGGLTPGSRYSITVKAATTYGSGPASTAVSVTVPKLTQRITFTSAAPTTARVGGPAYTVRAVGGASGRPVVVASASATVCTVTGSTVRFVRAGTCRITANQAGTAQYLPAPQVVQSFTVRSLVATKTVLPVARTVAV